MAGDNRGREALKSGLIKRIGSGTTVSIREDKWIPDTRTMSPVAHIGNVQLHHVSDLIDSGTWLWKYQVIRDNFIPPDADAILNIPIRTGGGDDILAQVKDIKVDLSTDLLTLYIRVSHMYLFKYRTGHKFSESTAFPC